LKKTTLYTLFKKFFGFDEMVVYFVETLLLEPATNKSNEKLNKLLEENQVSDIFNIEENEKIYVKIFSILKNVNISSFYIQKEEQLNEIDKLNAIIFPEPQIKNAPCCSFIFGEDKSYILLNESPLNKY